MSADVSTIPQLMDYWLEKRGGRIAPTRADMEPLDYPKLWAEIMIYKVHENPSNYEITRFGTELVEIWQKDYTGCFFNDISPESKIKSIKATFDEAVRSGEPSIEDLDGRWIDKKYLKYKRLLLPLSDDGKVIDRLLLCIQMEPRI